MCGIWGFISSDDHDVTRLFEAYMRIKNRGPDRSDFKIINEFVSVYLGFHRLAIMDRSTYGDQPFTYEIQGTAEDRSIYAICNGEIYNFKQLVEKYDIQTRSKSDCEFIPQLYAKLGFENMLKQLRGEYAVCVVDIYHKTNTIKIFISRDPLGVRPVFIGDDNKNGFGFSSTLAGLIDVVEPDTIRQLKHGEYIKYEINKVDDNLRVSIDSMTYHKLKPPALFVDDRYNDEQKLELILMMVREKFINSVICRLESDRTIGALLSGGLDSSLVVAIAARHLKKRGIKLRTFSIGMPGATDRKYAEMVAKHCDTEHTHFELDENDFLGALPEVVRATESWDTTTTRASTGQYLVCKKIRQTTDVKVLLIGDGSDEICSGYMYFHKAPTPEESSDENIRLGNDIRYFDALRSDRCIAYNGLEARTPFLDHEFVQLYLSIPAEYRVPRHELSVTQRKIEKWLLRKSFDSCYDDDDMCKSYLPKEVLWRKKEAFSDGVSSCEKSWFKIIQDDVEKKYSEKDFKDPTITYHCPPVIKEALHYRKLFNEQFHYKASKVIPYYWMPKWVGGVTDPSARVLDVY